MIKKDLTGKSFGTSKCIERIGTSNSHVQYKVYCARCEQYSVSSAANLLNQKRKYCAKCQNNFLSYAEEKKILLRYEAGEKAVHLAKEIGITRSSFYSLLKRVKARITSEKEK